MFQAPLHSMIELCHCTSKQRILRQALASHRHQARMRRTLTCCRKPYQAAAETPALRARLPATALGAAARRAADSPMTRRSSAPSDSAADFHSPANAFPTNPPTRTSAAAGAAEAAAAAAAAAADSATVADAAAASMARQPPNHTSKPGSNPTKPWLPAAERARRSPAARPDLPRPDFYATPPRRSAPAVAVASVAVASETETDSSDASYDTAVPAMADESPVGVARAGARTAGGVARTSSARSHAAGSPGDSPGLGLGSGGVGLGWAPEAGPALELLADAAAADAAAAAGARSAEALQARLKCHVVLGLGTFCPCKCAARCVQAAASVQSVSRNNRDNA